MTGAGRGIGREIALALARAGADLALAGREAETLAATADQAEREGVTALVIPTDVTDPAQVQRFAQRMLETFGRADGLVANSGVGGPSGSLWTLPIEGWQETFAVNVNGTFLCCRAFLPPMLEQGSGAVVVIGSMTGKRPLWGRSPYAASKLALVGLVRTLALETAASGVRVNLVSPGPVAGERIEWVFAAQAEGRGVSIETVREEFLAQIPGRRLVEPAEVAEAVVYLTLGAPPAVTGVDLNVSAGMVMY
ncbi:MAG TPA: SDR family oxidoreductase [Actinomycetota bacterium]|nr:SDR family oxidoreductase [Actinomycetota bacterium]